MSKNVMVYIAIGITLLLLFLILPSLLTDKPKDWFNYSGTIIAVYIATGGWLFQVWDKKDAIAKDIQAKQHFQKNAVRGMIIELEQLYLQVNAVCSWATNTKTRGLTVVQYPNIFASERPVFISMKTRLNELPEYAFDTVCMCEAKLLATENLFNFSLENVTNDIDGLIKNCEIYAGAIVNYIFALTNNNPEFEEQLTRAQITSKIISDEPRFE